MVRSFTSMGTIPPGGHARPALVTRRMRPDPAALAAEKADLPTRVRTDVVTRWLLARSKATVPFMVDRMRPTPSGPTAFTARNDEGYDITLHGEDAPILSTRNGEWIDWAGCNPIRLVGARVENGILINPYVQLEGSLPSTVGLAAAGRPVSTIIDDPRLKSLVDAVVESVDQTTMMQRDQLIIRLAPDWITHDL